MQRDSIRGIAPELDAARSAHARREGKNLHALALEALADGVGLGEPAVVRRDPADVAAGGCRRKGPGGPGRDRRGALEVRIALHTNAYVHLRRGDAATVRLASTAESVSLPFVVGAEQKAGFAMGRRSAENEPRLRRFLLKPGVSVLCPDDQSAHHYASGLRQLRHQGTPIPTNDLWIAAVVLQHTLVLRSRDGNFDNLPQILRA